MNGVQIWSTSDTSIHPGASRSSSICALCSRDRSNCASRWKNEGLVTVLRRPRYHTVVLSDIAHATENISLISRPGPELVGGLPMLMESGQCVGMQGKRLTSVPPNGLIGQSRLIIFRTERAES